MPNQVRVLAVRDNDRAKLERRVRRKAEPVRVAHRARIVLLTEQRLAGPRIAVDPTAADCKSVGVCLPRFESLTRHPEGTGVEQHRHGCGSSFGTSGAVRPCPAVHE
jgi:hypothetical protein